MLPVTHGEAFTRLHVLLYTLILTAVTLLPVATGMGGWHLSGLHPRYSMLIFLVLRLAASGAAIPMQLSRSTFRYSILYLSLLFAALLVDHYLRFPATMMIRCVLWVPCWP